MGILNEFVKYMHDDAVLKQKISINSAKGVYNSDDVDTEELSKIYFKTNYKSEVTGCINDSVLLSIIVLFILFPALIFACIMLIWYIRPILKYLIFDEQIKWVWFPLYLSIISTIILYIWLLKMYYRPDVIISGCNLTYKGKNYHYSEITRVTETAFGRIAIYSGEKRLCKINCMVPGFFTFVRWCKVSNREIEWLSPKDKAKKEEDFTMVFVVVFIVCTVVLSLFLVLNGYI